MPGEATWRTRQPHAFHFEYSQPASQVNLWAEYSDKNGKRNGLAVAKCNSPFGQIVGGQLHGDPVARQDADAVAPQSAGQVREHHAVMLQLYAEQTAGKLFQNNSSDFDIIFFTHSTFPYRPFPAPANRPTQWAASLPGPFTTLGQAPIVTFAACSPLGPRVTSNSTLEPSSRLR